MSFAATTQLPEPEAPPLLQDLARVFRQLGVQFVRLTVVDMASMGFQAAWSISENGELSDSTSERTMDSVFPGAAASVGQLASAPVDYTLLHKLSPGRWAYAWRLDGQNAVIAEAQYRERHDTVGEVEMALMRLTCSASLQQQADGVRGVAEPAPLQVWPQVDRRARQRPSRASTFAAALAGVAALLAAWLALVAAPQAASTLRAQQAQLQQLRGMADSTLVQGLSGALATGDYGEAQTELSQFLKLGYFSSAVVTNTKKRVVAMDGALERLRIGDEVTPEYAAMARALPLALGSEPQGQLLLVATPLPAGGGGSALQVVAALGAVAALASAALLALRLRRR